MRIIIEVEGDGGVPEVVLRSPRQATSTTVAPGVTAAGASGIDAGAAPVGDQLEAVGLVTAPSAAAPFDMASSHSAGAAPSFTTGG